MTLTDVFMMKQKEDESVDEYSARIAKALHDIGKPVNGETAVVAFINGLIRPLKLRLFTKQFHTLRQATDAAMIMKQMMELRQPTKTEIVNCSNGYNGPSNQWNPNVNDTNGNWYGNGNGDGNSNGTFPDNNWNGNHNSIDNDLEDDDEDGYSKNNNWQS